MKSIAMIFAALIMGFFLPAVGESINDFRTNEYTEPHIIATAAETTKDITLTQAVFNGATANIVITSNNTADAPVPSTYVAATKVLTVGGLNANDNHNLSVVYKINALTGDIGADIGAKTILSAYILCIFILIGGAVYTGSSRRGED